MYSMHEAFALVLLDKYKDYLSEPIIIHTKDLKQENGILYLPIYMTSLL